MSLKHFVSCIVCLSLALGLAVTARAGSKPFAVIGGGGQIAIGGGLPLPAQVFATSVTGTVFPPLLIPVRSGTRPIVTQTTTLMTRRRMVIPQSVLQVAPAQRTVGLFAHNPTLYAVATNLGYAWPAAQATLSLNGRAGANTTVFSVNVGGTAYITYTASAAGKFGGAARFAVTHGAGGIIANSPVTGYLVAIRPMGNPPCTHTALAGPNPWCIAALLGAWPLAQGAVGGTTGVVGMTTPLGPPIPGIGIGKFGASPLGTVSLFFFTPNANPGVTNRATSVAYPWTAGRITISHPFYYGPAPPEVFTLTGMDSRTAGGAGTIQLVAGSLSTRAVTGPNANRGWVKLQLREIKRTPTMSPAGLAATAGLMLVAVAYVLRRRSSA